MPSATATAHAIANVTAKIDLIGREDSIMKVYKDLTKSGRNKTNKRSGVPYNDFSDVVMEQGRKSNGQIAKKITFTIMRELIRGNFESDVTRHIDRSIARCGVDVEKRIYEFDRQEVAELSK